MGVSAQSLSFIILGEWVVDSYSGRSPMEIHGLHGVARVKEMEMAHSISHALGHPKTVGVVHEVVS